MKCYEDKMIQLDEEKWGGIHLGNWWSRWTFNVAKNTFAFTPLFKSEHMARTVSEWGLYDRMSN